MRILGSSHKHGLADDDVRHALRNGIYAFDEEEDVTIVIGPDRSARLLEIGVLHIEDGPVVIHAMPARPKYLRNLPFMGG